MIRSSIQMTLLDIYTFRTSFERWLDSRLLSNAYEFDWTRDEYVFSSFILSWIIERSSQQRMKSNIYSSSLLRSICDNRRKISLHHRVSLRIKWVTHKMRYSTRWNLYLDISWDISWSKVILLLTNCIVMRIHDLIRDLFQILYDDHAFYEIIKYLSFFLKIHSRNHDIRKISLILN